MRSLEIIYLSSLVLATSALWFGAIRNSRKLFLSGLAVALMGLLQYLVEDTRWQLLPAYVCNVLLLGCGLYLDRRQGPLAANLPRMGIFIKVAALFGHLLLLAAVLMPPYLMPVFQLPEPPGPYLIGSTYLHLVDDTRPELFTDEPRDRRELMVRVWYPAEPDPGASPMVYWPNAKRWSRIFGEYGGLPTFLFSHFDLVPTHAYLDAPLHTAREQWPVLLFSHGLTDGQINQNTSLMESLASSGYMVFSIGHTYETLVTEFPDGRVVPYAPQVETAFRADMEKVADLREAYQLSDDPQQKRALLLEKHSREVTINRSVKIWSEDTSFVIDTLERMNGEGDSTFRGHLDLDRIGVLGMSFGGCVAGQACLDDERIKAGVNLDGYPFGDAMTGQGPRQPFLLMQAVHKDPDETAFIYEFAQGPAYKVYVEGTTHLSYTDVVMWGRLIRLTGLPGSIEGRRMLQITADYTLAFFNRYLLGEEEELLNGQTENYPEVELTSRNQEN